MRGMERQRQLATGGRHPGVLFNSPFNLQHHSRCVVERTALLLQLAGADGEVEAGGGEAAGPQLAVLARSAERQAARAGWVPRGRRVSKQA